MEERKRRRELGLPEIYLYNKDTKAVSFHDFVHKELILFSNMDNERSIPSLVDGLKPGQRKVDAANVFLWPLQRWFSDYHNLFIVDPLLVVVVVVGYFASFIEH